MFLIIGAQSVEVILSWQRMYQWASSVCAQYKNARRTLKCTAKLLVKLLYFFGRMVPLWNLVNVTNITLTTGPLPLLHCIRVNRAYNPSAGADTTKSDSPVVVTLKLWLVYSLCVVSTILVGSLLFHHFVLCAHSKVQIKKLSNKLLTEHCCFPHKISSLSKSQLLCSHQRPALFVCLCHTFCTPTWVWHCW